MAAKLPRGSLDRMWNDPAHWRASVFYSCKEDPRVVVPKRQKWRGWTINFAHPFAAAVSVLAFVLPAIVILCVDANYHFFTDISGMVVALVLYAMAISVLSWFLSLPSRYEER